MNDNVISKAALWANRIHACLLYTSMCIRDSDKTIPKPTGTPNGTGGNKSLKLDQLLERLAHGEVNDANLALLRDYCATINNRYEDNPLRCV